MFFKESKIYLKLLFVFTTFFLSANENWQHHWHEGVKFYSTQKHDEASAQFDVALNMMSKEEKDIFPFVMVSKIENVIHEYGNLWIIDVNKRNCLVDEREEGRISS